MGKVIKRSQFFLSPSALNLFRDCARCFWLDRVKKSKRPRGIFPSLPSGMDRAIKDHFDSFRSDLVLPPELSGKELKGVRLFPDQTRLTEWRDWRTGLRFEDQTKNALLCGALDDLLVKGEKYIPFDYKTKGSPTTQEDSIRYYQNQMDCYALMLKENGFPPDDFAILIYYSPKRVKAEGAVEFQIQTIRVPTDAERARATFHAAITLMQGPEPSLTPHCEYCTFRK